MPSGRKRNLPCDCNAALENCGTYRGLYRVRCTTCRHAWKQVQKPPPKIRRTSTIQTAVAQQLLAEPPKKRRVAFKWSPERHEKHRQMLKRHIEQCAIDGMPCNRDAEPPDVVKIEGTHFELAPEQASRYRELRTAKVLAGDVPDLMSYDFAIPQ